MNAVKKRIWLAIMLLAALLLPGCALRTVDEMYCLPKRSDEYNNLQSAIDIAMAGLEYSAPLYGEHQQTVQMADLNGDGENEYLIFAKGTSEMPMQILIFGKDDDGSIHIMEVIASNGSAFEQVEYVEIDGNPGCELVVGRQLSDQVQRSVSVYSFAGGHAAQMTNAPYSAFLTCDLDGNGRREVMVMQHEETEHERGYAVLYSYRGGSMHRSVEAGLSGKVDSIKRIMTGKIEGGRSAVYIASSVDDSAIVTDIFALRNGRFVNISRPRNGEGGVETLRNFYVYAEDVDNDGVHELPDLINMLPVSSNWGTEEQHLIRWYAVDVEGNPVDKLYSFHNYVGGWFVELDSEWADRITISQIGNTYAFYMWNTGYTEATAQFTIYALTGSDRESQSTRDDRFALLQEEGVVYAAKLEEGAAQYGITKEYLINRFHLIHQDWNTGET